MQNVTAEDCVCSVLDPYAAADDLACCAQYRAHLSAIITTHFIRADSKDFQGSSVLITACGQVTRVSSCTAVDDCVFVSVSVPVRFFLCIYACMVGQVAEDPSVD